MKINPMHSVNAYRKQQEVTEKSKPEVGHKRDEVKISEEAKKMQQSSKTELDRQEKLKGIKDRIESGTYKVNQQEVARKFYDFWSK